ncbi:uncharacterized protein [Antedon mediterranea]|uniref:uncharacterized protein n=1 Tax=Antedon mediterranea TaxID=105859 RepID=UPI003AF5D6F0
MQQVRQMFEMDFVEHVSTKKGYSVEDHRFISILSSKIVKRNDGHYEMPLPMCREDVRFPNNRLAAVRRALQLKRKFKRNSTFKEHYIAFMNGILAGYAEKVPESEYGVTDDDGLKSLPTIQQAIELVKSSTELCASAGLVLHKWMSNKRAVLEAIPEEQRAKGLKTLDIKTDPLPIERALGVTLCVEADTFQFRIVLKDCPLSRRGVLSTISSLYDALGFAAPVVFEGKIILQEMCRENVGWDEPIPSYLYSKWEKWRKEIVALKQLQIQRCYKTSDFGEIQNVELHYFSDASEFAYGQCTYLRIINRNNRCACSLVIAKARVAPLRRVYTIPRLELSAAVISARMSKFVKEELNYDHHKVNEFFWTDSQVVLGYINNEAKRFHVFVANRIQQIHEFSSCSDWYYVNSSSNPSDIASREVSAKKLMETPSWFNGAEFLNQDGPFKNVQVS